ncbi:MAG TPA: RNA polymerase sigma factor [Thermoanaerobacterales bacterium]|jgi:RNA polymerase sigma factor (sigma-70 family)|nr:RNA polymerase sigma factor [Thermoanaerobacterales bacterium]
MGSLLRTNEELKQMYTRHVKTVYRVCFLYMKNKADSEDMVQNTFLRLMGDKTVFQSTEHEKAWLIRTAINLCKDYYRSWWSRTLGLDKALEASVEQGFEIDETLSKVLALPPKYKTALYLYYYEGYSTPEIAEMMGKPQSTVRSWLHTGRKRLKIEIEGEGELA